MPLPAEPLVTTAELEQIHARATALAFSTRHLATQPHPGPRPSLYRGQGLELHDLRSYQHGDDVRHIAWRASARGGPPLVKIFHAEQRQRRFLMVDQHTGMAFGTGPSLKAATAVRCVAALAFMAISRHDDVGGLIVGDSEHACPYASSIDHVLAILRRANHLPRQRHWSRPPLAATLQRVRHLAGERTTVHFISDFHDWDERLAGPLAALGEYRELHALQIIDAGEQQLPAAGKLRLISPFNGQRYVVDSDDADLRRRYREHMQQRQEQLQDLLRRHGVRHHRIDTHDDVFEALWDSAHSVR